MIQRTVQRVRSFFRGIEKLQKLWMVMFYLFDLLLTVAMACSGYFLFSSVEVVRGKGP